MRNLLILIVFLAKVVYAAWADYEETRELTLDAEGLATLGVEAGAGSLAVRGAKDADRIVVSALITVPDADVDEAARVMEEEMVLSLVENGDRAELKGFFEDQRSWFGDSPSIRLEIRVPARMSLDVEDGSGSIEIRDVAGDIRLTDGSGSISMSEVGGMLQVRDGSGSLEISGAGGDVDVVDGSGSIGLRRVRGSATIEDGSGSIDVSGVAGDVTIPEAGSGAVDVRDVAGQVAQQH